MDTPLNYEFQHIDDIFFEEMRDLLEEDFIPLVHSYIESSSERIQFLKDAIADNNHSKGFDMVHSLKGASANLGLTHLTDLCHQMQEIFRLNETINRSKVMADLEQEVIVTNALIQKRLEV